MANVGVASALWGDYLLSRLSLWVKRQHEKDLNNALEDLLTVKTATLCVFMISIVKMIA
jgi:hypothetical protein